LIDVRVLEGDAAAAAVAGLADVLLDCVRGGASVSFMDSLTDEEARAFYETVREEAAAGRRLLLAAFDGDEVVGTVQVLLATPPNAPHRGEIAKLLVRRSARGRGIGVALMERAESEARAVGKTLLVLDTASGAAEHIYTQLGWTRVGDVPDYALYPDGRPVATTFFYKRI
jgi:GNAT superfamily N-acetyltransferase